MSNGNDLMMSSNPYDHIMNMMTLRYDPLEQPSIRLRDWSDFLPQEASNFENRLQDLIKKEMVEKISERGYERVGIALSGGVDSTFILSQLRKILPDIRIEAFCATFKDTNDETYKAKKIANIFNCDFKEIEIMDPFIKLKDLVRLTGEPRWNLYFYYVLEAASKNCEIILTGDGGDELFGGYTFRYSKFLSNLKPNDGWQEKVINYLECHERDWVPDQEKLFGTKINFSWERIRILFKKYFDNELPALDQIFLADFNGKLVFDWIPTNKKFSEYLGIECYSPFLSDTVMDFATHIPNIQKYDHKTNLGKKILRSCLEHAGIPLDNQKMGFGMDLVTMWKRSGRLWIERYLASNALATRKGIISREWLKSAYVKANVEESPRYINKLFSILSLEMWLQEFGGDL